MDQDEPHSPGEETPVLSEVELRVLGSLIEKELSTPEYYPLTLNALTNACNQKSNRFPAMSLEPDEVRDALETLRQKRLAMMFHGADSRVPKFKHTFDSALNIDRPEKAILCELMVRGPQTPGELRSRCERLHSFATREEVEERLRALENYPGRPLVAKLPRRSGQKEQRYAHLLGGTPEEPEVIADSPQPSAAPAGRVAQLAEEVERQRSEIDSLKADVAALQAELTEFRKQFE